MTEGTYRIVQGEDGVWSLYLFPPSGGHAAIVLDNGELVVLSRTGAAHDLSPAVVYDLFEDLRIATPQNR